MNWLIVLGTLVSLAGLAGLIWCIVTVARAKREGLTDDALRGRLQRVIPVNMAALFMSAIGLMLVVLGIIFG